MVVMKFTDAMLVALMQILLAALPLSCIAGAAYLLLAHPPTAHVVGIAAAMFLLVTVAIWLDGDES